MLYRRPAAPRSRGSDCLPPDGFHHHANNGLFATGNLLANVSKTSICFLNCLDELAWLKSIIPVLAGLLCSALLSLQQRASRVVRLFTAAQNDMAIAVTAGITIAECPHFVTDRKQCGAPAH